MKQLKDMKRWPIAMMIIGMSLLQACSIIEDSDIQSQEELDTKLKLSKITFIEQYDDIFNADALTIVGTTSFNNAGQIAKIDWGGGINLNDNKVGLIARFNYLPDDVSVTFPGDEDAPLQAVITSNITYNSNGQPSKITHVDEINNFQFESFEFTYNSQGKMATMVTTRNSIGGTLNQMTTDVITYENEQLASVNRTTVNLNTMAETLQTITLTRRTSGLIREIKFDFLNGTHRFFDQQNINNAGSYFYFSQLTTATGSGDPAGNPVIKPVFSKVIQSMQLIDQRLDGNNFAFDPDRNPDVFFIHPLLILPDLFDDFELSQIFINDWWLGSSIRDVFIDMYRTDRIAHVKYEYTVD